MYYNPEEWQAIGPYWPCPEEFKTVHKNLLYFDGIYEAFVRLEQRNPTSFEEILNSPYMIIPLEHFVNPYQNRPIQETPYENPVPGDYSLVTTSEGLHILLWVTLPSPPFSQPETLHFDAGPAKPESIQPAVFWSFDDSQWAQTASPEEKKLYTIAEVIWNAAWYARWLIKRSPIDWDEFQETFYWAQYLTNPYTGQPLQMVSHKTPSVGNCTYSPQDFLDPFRYDEFGNYNLPPREIIRQNYQYMDWPEVSAYCYNHNLEPVAHYKFMLQDKLDENAWFAENGSPDNTPNYIP